MIANLQCIRGVYASASLKRIDRRGNIGLSHRIRGVYASASLKPLAVQESGAEIAVHPRCLRLGLIEAISSELCGKTAKSIRGVYASASLKPLISATRLASIATHPRCLRLGLIEAPPAG